MGTSLQLRVYRSDSTEAFREAVVQAAATLHGSLTWAQSGRGPADLRLSSKGCTHTLYIPYQALSFPFCQEIGCILDAPWIEIRIQEGSLWDYTLYRGAECVDRFSVAPEYWLEPKAITEDYLREQRGNPQKLSTLWDIPVERIERYLVSWGFYVVDEDTFAFRLKGKAYETDRFEYGNPDQMDDFLKALGGEFPMENHTLTLPTTQPGRP
jgi:hypothetical protein